MNRSLSRNYLAISALVAVMTGVFVYSVMPTPIKTRAAALLQGDINGDGKVDIFDLSILLANFGKSVNPTPTRSVPPIPTPIGSGGGSSGSGTVNCPLTHAGGADGINSCWALHTGVQGSTGYSEAQIKAGAPGFTHIAKNLIIGTSGTTIDHEWISGCVSILSGANNVTIRNSLITPPDGDYCNGGDNNFAPSGISNGQSGTTGFIIEDTTLDGGNSSGNQFGLSVDNGKVLRVNVLGFAKNFETGSNTAANPTLFQDDYSHDLSLNSCAGYPGPGGCTTQQGGASSNCAHDNGFYMNSSIYFTIKHSYSILTGAGYCTTGAITNLSDYGIPHDFTIDSNYMEGMSGADLYTGKANTCGTPNVKVTNNEFSNDNGFSGSDLVNYWTPVGNVWSGNHIAETGVAFDNPPSGC